MARRVSKKLTYRVWFEQVNQTYIDVTAADEEQATEKAIRLWFRDEAVARVGDIEEVSLGKASK